MSYYINDIATFSGMGFEKVSLQFIQSIENMEITDYHSEHLVGKGLRFVPRTALMLHNVLAEILKTNDLTTRKDKIGLYNTSDICALEAGIDFDLEVENYGVKLANPMKVPYTLNGATAGWLGIRNKMHNINLSVNAGRCGMLSALNLAGLDFMDKETSFAIILGAHYMGEAYQKYNRHCTFNKEIAVGMLVSKKRAASSMVEITECRTMAYDKTLLVEMIDHFSGFSFIDSDFYLNLQNHKRVRFISSTSAQLPCLPFFIHHLRDFIPKDSGKEHHYLIVDKRGMMGYMKFRIPKS